MRSDFSLNTSTCQKKNIRAFDRESLFGIVPAASHPVPSPDRNHAPKRIASTAPYSQGFRLLYRHSRRRLGSPWVDPINAALKCLKLATVTPGATSTLSVSSVSRWVSPRHDTADPMLPPLGNLITMPKRFCLCSL